MSILCELCEGFHRPRLTNEWNAKEGTRACVRSGDGEMYGKTTCNLFPTYAHFDLVAAITRSCRHSLGSYSPRLLESTIHFTDASAQIKCNIHAKVIDGRLIVKIEKILFPGYQPARELHGLPNLVRLLTTEDDLASCCPHIRWVELHPVVFEPEEGNDAEQGKTVCLWQHPGSCWRVQQRYPQPDKCRGEVTPELSKIWGCHFCYTDMTVSYRHFDESVGVNLVALTAWKDLGRGISIHDPAWKTHSVVPGASSRQCDVGSLYHLFEGKEGRKASIPYVPEFTVEGFRRVHGTLPASFTA
ncbi:hypothetical protein CEP54_006219 [Fusarium duplospermum]|uniref:Uncharacterized protein n=1 Tax=Fusarium duplospermum TaxID=1325734 RepID=A0A428Q897_9HYPO|nr:hypothetical protein CEP54_006219 [Fusarium duplospermum]